MPSKRKSRVVRVAFGERAGTPPTDREKRAVLQVFMDAYHGKRRPDGTSWKLPSWPRMAVAAELPTLSRLTFQSCIEELVDDEYLEEAPPLASAVGDWLLPDGRVLTLAMGDADVDRELSAEVGGALDGAAWLTVLVNGQPRQRVCAEGGGIPDIWLRITRRGREWLASAPADVPTGGPTKLAAELPATTAHKPPEWTPPTDYVGAAEVQTNKRFRKPGTAKNPARSLLTDWQDRDKPPTIRDPASGEVYWPEEWILNRISTWNPRPEHRNTPPKSET